MRILRYNNTITTLIIIFYSLTTTSTFQVCWQISLSSFTGIRYTLSYQYIINNLQYTQCYLKATNKQQYEIFYKTCEQMFPNFPNSTQNNKQIQFWNYQTFSTKLTICIAQIPQQSLSNSQTLSYDQILNNIVIISAISLSNQHMQIAVIFKQDVEEYMLPFNLISQKNSKILVNQNLNQLSYVRYKNQPFLSTYWNQINKDQISVTWLPYFSQCLNFPNHRMFLNDLLSPITEEQNLCHQQISFLFGSSLVCENKKIQTKCMLQELNVDETSNSLKQPWWKNSFQPPYYLMKKLISKQQYVKHLGGENDGLTDNFFKTMVPLKYELNFDNEEQVPNHFEFYFQLKDTASIEEYQLVLASLKGSRDSDYESELRQNQAILSLTVNYYSQFDAIWSLDAPFYTYFFIFPIITVLILFFILKILKSKSVNLNFTKIRRNFINPTFKGFIISITLTILFILFFYNISQSTKYQLISVTFNTIQLGSLDPYYAGRSGLTLLLSGCLFLIIAISLSFKILKADEARVILQDEEDNGNKGYQNEYDGSQGNNEERQNFIIKNMYSQRRYLFLFIACTSIFLLLFYYIIIELSIGQIIPIILILYPVLQKMVIVMYRHFFIRQMLYLFMILTSLEAFTDYIFINDFTIFSLWGLYFCKLFAINVVNLAIERISDHLAFTTYNYLLKSEKDNHITLLYRFFNNYREEIKNVATQSKYQKSLYYTCIAKLKLTATLVKPFQIFLLILTIENSKICQDLRLTYNEVLICCTFLISTIPIQILMLVLNVKYLDANKGLCIKKCVEFSLHNFKNRKIKWVNDIFWQNRGVQDFYKELDKFCFSSQMYIILFLTVYSLLAIFLGWKIILQHNYVVYYDPALLVIFCIIWAAGYILSALLSFISIKFKIYNIKEEAKGRGKLENVEKILKIDDFTQYLQLGAVKRYFLFYCKDKIAKNITTILDKEDFEENNKELMIKYRHFKSLLKKRQIDEKKMLERQSSMSNYHTYRQNIQGDKKAVVRIQSAEFIKYAKPMLYSWFYIAKQFSYLRSLIKSLKEQKKKETCEFCSMTIELEVLQKIELSEIINQYRLMNVGELFQQEYFIQFYKLRQEYLTICVQCKQKKSYLQKKQLQLHGATLRIVKKWLICARSNRLHRQHQKNYFSSLSTNKKKQKNNIMPSEEENMKSI